MKAILAIILATTSLNCFSETWELSVSQDRSLDVRLLKSKSFRIDLGTKDVKINYFFWQARDRSCTSDYGKKYGAYSFNDTRVKLEFTCEKGHIVYRIATVKGMEFATDFLMNHKIFQYQFTSPDTVFGKGEIKFKMAAIDLVNSPAEFKESHEATRGNWYGSEKHPSQFELFDNIKKSTTRFIIMKYHAQYDALKLSVNLSEARWNDGGYSKPLAACSYSSFSGKSGTVYINDISVEIPIKCQHYNSISYFPGSDTAMVSDVGYLVFDEKITLSPKILKQIKNAKAIDIRLDIEGIQKNILSRKITLSRSLVELIDKLNEKRKQDSDTEKKKKSSIKQQIDSAM